MVQLQRCSLKSAIGQKQAIVQLFHVALEILAGAMRLEEEIIGMRIEKGETIIASGQDNCLKAQGKLQSNITN